MCERLLKSYRVTREFGDAYESILDNTRYGCGINFRIMMLLIG